MISKEFTEAITSFQCKSISIFLSSIVLFLGPSFARPKLRFEGFKEKKVMHDLAKEAFSSLSFCHENGKQPQICRGSPRHAIGMPMNGSFSSESCASNSPAVDLAKENTMDLNSESEREITSGRGFLAESFAEGETPTKLPRTLRKLRREFFRYYLGCPVITRQMVAQAQSIFSSTPPQDTAALLAAYKNKLWPLDLHLDSYPISKYGWSEKDEVSGRKPLDEFKSTKEAKMRKGSLGVKLEIILQRTLSKSDKIIDEVNEIQLQKAAEEKKIASRHPKPLFSTKPKESSTELPLTCLNASRSSKTINITSNFPSVSTKRFI